MKGQRVFFNGRTGRNEVWLDSYQRGFDGKFFWVVTEYGETHRGTFYSATDEEYAEALADYERRVAERKG